MRDPQEELEEIAKQLWWELNELINHSSKEFLKIEIPPIIEQFKALDIDFCGFMCSRGQIYSYDLKNKDWIDWL